MHKFAALILACALFCLGSSPKAYALTADELKPALEDLLKKHPEVLLDFLNTHCEEMLDIAQRGSNQRRLAKFEQQWQQDVKIPKKVNIKGRPRTGKANAKVQIIAFSDFTCHFCLNAEKVMEQILDEYKGKVSFVFKNTPLDPNGVGGLASQYFLAIHKKDPNLTWKYYKMLFNNRDSLIAEGEEFLRKSVSELGLDINEIDRLRRQKAVTSMLDEDLKDADTLGVDGTPYFLINNLVIRGAASIDVFRKAIDLELSR